MITIGVDPGLHGAIAVYDAAAGAILEILDMPTFETLIGKKARLRIDKAQLLHEVGRIRARYSPAFVTIEELVAPPPIDKRSGRKRSNGAGGLLAQGRVYGEIEMAFAGFRYRIEYAHPATWKARLRAPALKSASVARADELFPAYGKLWRGPCGGALADRAEAAMIAKYGADTWLTK